MKKEIIEKHNKETEKNNEQLDKCIIADNPEMIRNHYDDEPCDDSRA